MIPIDKLESVFRIDAGGGPGTAFTLEVDGKQYVVTAQHLVGSEGDPKSVQVWRFEKWHDVQVQLIGSGSKKGPPETDFAVFACNEQISTFSQEANRGGYFLSQDVYFLGYPYNSMTDGIWTPNLEFPLVKKAIVSGILKTEEKSRLLVLDGHNNPGFSGGPVLAKSPEDKKIRAIGIISGFQTDLIPVDMITETSWAEVNAGIVYAALMPQVLDAIEANPIGHPVTGGWDWPSSRFVV